MDHPLLAIEYFSRRYTEAMDRYVQLEEKSGRLLTLLTALVPILSALTAWWSVSVGVAAGECEQLIYVLLVTTIAMLACAWFCALISLKVGAFPAARSKHDAAQYLKGASADDAADYILDCYVDAVNDAGSTNEDKAAWVRRCFRLLIAGSIPLAVLGILLTLRGWQ